MSPAEGSLCNIPYLLLSLYQVGTIRCCCFFVHKARLKYSGVDLIMHIPITELTSERMSLVLKENFLKEKKEVCIETKSFNEFIACNRSKSCTNLGASIFFHLSWILKF